MKTCKTCSSDLPLTSFYQHKQMADGHLNFCKQCVRARVLSNRSKKIDKYREYDRDRGFRVYNRSKVEARAAVYNAIRRGEITKESCWCGAESEAHHEDYSKPLEVVWLCKKHHGERHVELRELAYGSH